VTDTPSGSATRWIPIGKPEALSFTPGATVNVEGQEVAVFAVPEAASGYCALLNSCPHAGAALAEGHVSNGEVSCPWHGWRFDLRTGVCRTIAEDSTRAFPVRLRDGVLELGWPA
jgi:nitrite reductase (NADH) small subunit/3-phenylpropionate/trans-cinnamate dioxygenase ferredoxin subunit